MPKISTKTYDEGSVKVLVEDHMLVLSNLDKIYFPQIELTKGELIKYYMDMAPYILPHLKGSPFVMVRYPEGVNGNYFYQKECPAQAPEWIRRFRDPSSKQGLNYLVCDNLSSLVYLINLGCIEIHAWASTYARPEYPEWAVFDLDPDPPSGVNEALQVAHWLGDIFKELKLNFMVKTSGSTGIHVLVPLQPHYTYAAIQKGVEGVCRFLVGQSPEMCTIERSIKKRAGKVYLDYLQNGHGRTMAGIYSVRPSGQGTISTPLLWQEVVEGVESEKFHIRNFRERLRVVGDLSTIMLKKCNFKPILHYFT